MNIESLSVNDLDAINGLKPENWGNFEYFHAFYLKNSFCFPKKVVIDNEIAGIGTAICNKNTGWIAHIVVSTKYRNKGLGSFIVSSLQDHLTNKCLCKSITLLASELGYPVYKKLGFVTQSEYVTFTSEKEAENVSVSPTIRPMDTSYLLQVFELDRKVTGEDRSAIIGQYIDGSYVNLANDRVMGFYLSQLGEGLIISIEKKAGIELLRMKMSRDKKVVLPSENEAAREFLVENGYKESSRMRRMVYGDTFEWEPQNVYSRIGGNLG